MSQANLAFIIPLILLAVIVTTPATVTEDAFARYQGILAVTLVKQRLLVIHV